MKRPQEPKPPSKPQKPWLPEPPRDTIKEPTVIRNIYESCCYYEGDNDERSYRLSDLIKMFEGENPDDIVISFRGYGVTIEALKEKEVPNPRKKFEEDVYKENLARYKKEIAKLPEKMEKFKKELEEYKEKLAKYREQKDLYDLEDAKKSLEKNLLNIVSKRICMILRMLKNH